jgi:hypothetical protein
MVEVDAGSRTVTPPPQAANTSELQLTPEQVKRIEINRLKGMFVPLVDIDNIYLGMFSQGQATPTGTRRIGFYIFPKFQQQETLGCDSRHFHVSYCTQASEA